MDPARWQEIERLFHAALASPAEGRAAFLAEACDGDEALRREVERLLARASETAGFLSAPVVVMAGSVSSDSQPTTSSMADGPYEIRNDTSRLTVESRCA